MKIRSEKNEQFIPLKILKCNTFLKRLKGLMFRVKPILDEGILIKPCNSIHMFFMNFPIDIIFLDKQNTIIYLREDVKPWTVILPQKKARSVIEIPVGTISKYSIQIGDKIYPD